MHFQLYILFICKRLNFLSLFHANINYPNFLYCTNNNLILLEVKI